MPYAVIARWNAKAGEEDAVQAALEALAPLSRAEPGNRYYQPTRSPDDTTQFLIFEVYDDEAAFQAHRESPHFAEHALGNAVPRLESREVQFFETFPD